MMGSVVISGIGFFLICLLIHLLVREQMKIQQEIFSLIVIFLVLPVVGLAGAKHLLHMESIVVVSVAAVTIACSLVYVLSYPALKTRVPTLHLLLLIHQSGEAGLAAQDVDRSMKDEGVLFGDKVQELCQDRLIDLKDGVCSLTLLGAVLANLFVMYRKALGLESGLG